VESNTNWDELKKFAEKWNAEQAKQSCPNCGYCPHCGRSTSPHYPWWQRPWYSGPYWQVTPTATITLLGDTANTYTVKHDTVTGGFNG
jgi:hypothetical protein